MTVTKQTPDYDLVLIFTAFQRNCVYASLIKELGSKYKVALFPIERDAKTQSRIGNTNSQFLELCKSLGADIIVNQKVFARLEVLAQSNYSQEDMNLINSSVFAEKTFWMSGVAMGNACYENLYGKKIDKLLVPDRQLYNYRIATYGNDGIDFPDCMLQEIGMPYKKYPLFEDDIQADYILANPTPFSFVTAQDKLDYLNHVDAITEKISQKNEVIAFKPHNADERADYIVNKYFHKVLNYVPFHNSIDAVLKRLKSWFRSEKINNLLTELLIAIVYHRVMLKVIPLSDLTPYHNFNLEVFLPKVRKGLITGRSNSMWHGLFLNKAVYNCIDETKPYFSDTKMHKYAMNYLGVHGKHQTLNFNEELCNVISESCRNADLVQVLDEELTLLSKTETYS